MKTIGAVAGGSCVLRADKALYPCFHPLAHVGSLPVTARCPSGILEPELHGRASQRRCNVGAASTSASSSFSYGHFKSMNDPFYKLRFGLGSAGGRRHGFRVSRATEDGGGENGGGKTTSTATEEPEKEPPPVSSISRLFPLMISASSSLSILTYAAGFSFERVLIAGRRWEPICTS